MAHDVFISYASPDKPTADAVCARLEQQGVRCWIAPRDIQLGADYADSIIEALGEARAMVLVFSTHANESVHVRREVERAADKGMPILPFRIEAVAPKKSLEYFLSSPHWLDALTPPLERHLSNLAEAVKAVLGKLTDAGTRIPPAGMGLAPAPMVPPPVAPAAPPRFKRMPRAPRFNVSQKHVARAGAVAAAALLVAFGGWGLFRYGKHSGTSDVPADANRPQARADVTPPAKLADPAPRIAAYTPVDPAAVHHDPSQVVAVQPPPAQSPERAIVQPVTPAPAAVQAVAPSPSKVAAPQPSGEPVVVGPMPTPAHQDDAGRQQVATATNVPPAGPAEPAPKPVRPPPVAVVPPKPSLPLLPPGQPFVFSQKDRHAPVPSDIPLTYMPTERVDRSKVAAVVPPDRLMIYIPPVADERTRTESLGRNTDENPVVKFQTSDSPTDYVRSAIAKEFADAGFNVTDDPARATCALRLVLSRFTSDVHSGFDHSVVVVADLRDSNGCTVWSVSLTGHNTHGGNTSNMANVQEGLGNCMVTIAEQLLIRMARADLPMLAQATLSASAVEVAPPKPVVVAPVRPVVPPKPALPLLPAGRPFASITKQGAADPVPSNIPLVYRPNERLDFRKYSGVVPPDRLVVYLAPTVDERTSTDTIGRNNDERPVILFRTADSPGEYVRAALAKEFAAAGIAVTDDPSKATCALRLTLQQFTSIISGPFKGDIVLGVELRDAAGVSVWNTTFSGHNEKGGRGGNMENVQENLGNCVIALADPLLTRFLGSDLQSLARGPLSPSAVAPAPPVPVVVRPKMRPLPAPRPFVLSLKDPYEPTTGNIPLTYLPNERLDVRKFRETLPPPESNLVLYIAPVTDDRTQRETIGRNTEAKPNIPFRTPDSPADYVRGALAKELAGAGIEVTDDPSRATRILRVSLERFNCNVDGNFKSDVTITAELGDKGGSSLWTANLTGHDEHGHRASNMANLQEGVGNCVISLADQLLSKPEAMKALR